jgi:hypothetical protein
MALLDARLVFVVRADASPALQPADRTPREGAFTPARPKRQTYDTHPPDDASRCQPIRPVGHFTRRWSVVLRLGSG